MLLARVAEAALRCACAPVACADRAGTHSDGRPAPPAARPR